MKKKLAFILSALLALGSLASCSSGQTTATPTEPKASDEAVVTTKADNADETTVQTETKPETTTTARQEKKNFEVFVEKPSIEETVILDEKDVKITASELEYSGRRAELKLKIENNSDKDLSFISGSLGYSCNSINGYMTTSIYINEKVSAGKKASKSVSISEDDLKMYGIKDIAEIEIGFDINDDNYKDYLVTGPLKIRTSAYDSYDPSSESFGKAIKDKIIESEYGFTIDYFSDNEIYNEDDIKVVSESVITNKSGEKKLFLEIENNSPEQINMAASNISINGLTVYGSNWTSDTVNAGKRCMMDISFSSLLDESYWELFGISDISDVCLYLSGRNMDYDEIIKPREVNVNIMSSSNMFDNSGDELANDNEVRIVSKGFVEDSSDYSDDIHFILLVENNTSSYLSLDDNYDSLSVNGYMINYFCTGCYVDAGRSAFIDVEIRADSLKENDIEKIEEIEEIEISFKARDDKYSTIAEPKISMAFNQ